MLRTSVSFSPGQLLMSGQGVVANSRAFAVKTKIVSQIAQKNGRAFAKGHLRRDLAISIADTLAMFFQKFRQSRLGYAEM